MKTLLARTATILLTTLISITPFSYAQLIKVAFIKEQEEAVNEQIPKAIEGVGCDVTLVDGTNYKELKWSDFDIIWFSTISITNPVGMSFSDWMDVKDKIWEAVKEDGIVVYIGHHDDGSWNAQVAGKGFLPYETKFFEMPQGFKLKVLKEVKAFKEPHGVAVWEKCVNDAPIDWAKDYEPLAVAKDNPDVGVLLQARWGKGFILISAVDDSAAGSVPSPDNKLVTENIMGYLIELRKVALAVNPLKKLPLIWGEVKVD